MDKGPEGLVVWRLWHWFNPLARRVRAGELNQCHNLKTSDIYPFSRTIYNKDMNSSLASLRSGFYDLFYFHGKECPWMNRIARSLGPRLMGSGPNSSIFNAGVVMKSFHFSTHLSIGAVVSSLST